MQTTATGQEFRRKLRRTEFAVLSLPGKSFRLRPKSPKLSPQQFPAFGRAL
jgi:hypothetical protein